jgi:hypothetical protein
VPGKNGQVAFPVGSGALDFFVVSVPDPVLRGTGYLNLGSH